jgi:hypothetical protein
MKTLLVNQKIILLKTALLLSLSLSVACFGAGSGSESEDEEIPPSKKSPLFEEIGEELESEDEDDLLTDDAVKIIYSKQCKISQKFLDFSHKRKNIPLDVHLKIIDFAKDYISRPPRGFVEIDISGLSSRSRIYLLSSIIDFKNITLPKIESRNFRSVDYNDSYWVKSQRTTIPESIDKFPVKLRIGTYEYEFQLGATEHQKGAGRIFGLYEAKKADTYKTIYEKTIQNLSDKKSRRFGRALLAQKKSGSPITTFDESENKFLNGLNLLLDYEVARRLHRDDFLSQDIPIIFYIDSVITNLKINFKKFLVGDEENKAGKIKNKSLVKGSKKVRLEKLMHAIRDLSLEDEDIIPMRDRLSYLHKDEERSDDSYSDDDRADDSSDEFDEEDSIHRSKNIKKDQKEEEDSPFPLSPYTLGSGGRTSSSSSSSSQLVASSRMVLFADFSIGNKYMGAFKARKIFRKDFNEEDSNHAARLRTICKNNALEDQRKLAIYLENNPDIQKAFQLFLDKQS